MFTTLRFSSLKSYLSRAIPTLARSAMEPRSYEDAVMALNSLQTNAQVLAQVRKTRARLAHDNLEEMRMFTQRAGVTMEMLDQLSVIHVSGTKGKGSTCAFSESILRNTGYKTGFFSSPHLIEVRERIRIDGKSLSKELFTKYFFECWDSLQESKDGHEGKMPAYFRFTTLMSFYVFLQEKVDVAIIEVGIGGLYDSTNIIRKPAVCGVTSLGMDHVQTLGGSLESIAWQKAGIFKPGVPAFTVEQEESALQVVFQRAKEVKSPLHLVPALETYPGKIPDLGLDGEHQHLNASMALQLCNTWLKRKQDLDKCQDIHVESHDDEPSRKKNKNGIPVVPTFKLADNFRKGLRDTVWRGRCQTIVRPDISIYLDGAHTPKSMDACVSWFKKKADQEVKDTEGPVARVLLFNLTGDRDPHGMFRPLMGLKFDHAVFCPNSVSLETKDNSGKITDLKNFMVTRDNQLRCCVENQRVWMALRGAGYQPHPTESPLDGDHVVTNGHDDGAYSTIFPCVAQAIRWVAAGRDPLIPTIANTDLPTPGPITSATRIQLLVTGSLHLVGTAMKVLGTQVMGEI